MNSICGIYYRNEETDADEFDIVMRASGKYPAEASHSFSDNQVFLGCHLNRIVPESLNEVLPYETGNAVITADAIIDNREELFLLLAIPEENQNMPDSLLILEAYRKWGKNCPEKLVGDFAFAIWDKSEEMLFCARDHVGRKTFYYYLSEKQFAFSTLIKPLLELKCVQRKLNDDYIADFLTLPSVVQELDPHITIYEEVYQLPPASAVILGRNYSKTWQYWKIKKTKEITFESEEEYEEAFRRIYNEAVQCRLRCVKKIGVTLSGGLDSGSIACLAAAELKKRNEKLYSFTQVPMAGYQNWLPEHQLADEREYVLADCNFAGNIEPFFLPCEGVSSLTEADGLLDILEQPYKFIENSFWLCEILKHAASKDLGIVLNGQLGNFTVSWGSYMSYFLYLLKKLHWITYMKSVKAYCKTQKIKLTRFLLSNIHKLLPLFVIKCYYRLRGGEDYVRLSSPVNTEFYRRVKEKKRLKRFRVDPMYLKIDDSFRQRVKLLNPAIFSHIGAVQSKLSLAYGIEQRDPTADKRLIEFCMNLPEKLWLRGGMQRGFLRCAMKGIMPDKVRLNVKYRGRQAADWVQRILPSWEETRAEISRIGDEALERKYLDITRIQQFLAENHDPDAKDDGVHGLRLLLRALIFSRFLRRSNGA